MNSHYPADDARERGEPLNDVSESFVFHQFTNFMSFQGLRTRVTHLDRLHKDTGMEMGWQMIRS
jgi:hypothetical protein